MMQLILPEDTFPQLFKDAAFSGLIEDGKILADAVPLFSPAYINEAYMSTKGVEGFDLLDFLKTHFIFNDVKDSGFKTDSSLNIRQHIDSLWTYLTREADVIVPGSSLIPLPYKYVVPGGRFNEIYYWDSYFTMLGLRVAGRIDLIEAMVANFAFLIHEVGFIPNGNRTYFLSRSQPPFFAMMVELLAELRGKDIFKKYLPMLLKEYQFWMSGEHDNTESGTEINHVVYLDKKSILNRYWDQLDTPRSEMYKEDVLLASGSKKDPVYLFRNLRSACESGWDFSSRWCGGTSDLGHIATTDILPVDLNCLIYQLEMTIYKAYVMAENDASALTFKLRAETRAKLIESIFWNEQEGYYYDYNVKEGKQTNAITMAGIYPLVFGLTSPGQAQRCLAYMEKHLMKDGGLMTTTIKSGQQWDAPNGWAPLQWMAFRSAINYKQSGLAMTIAKRWTTLIEAVFEKTGKIMEKYNVVDKGLESGGGEYPVQDGFGWTNGVYLAMQEWIVINERNGKTVVH
ncbi:MAG: alpha,alpha-trehalase TreF [Saprospiraceae bacterium]|nr:alpha,alpha-trehalase TreF [Saprospiraceae bacterium]